ncbi:response regulator [Altericista sp. CCNU0014]|uniref:response regulator n=1 Tax=Altericista sp. CCNU0014 TaxID=3082949 RepID=UPI00384D7498
MNVSVLSRPIEILLVEDNPGDVELTALALEESQLWVRLNVVENGVAALDFLYRQSGYAKAPHPDLILLDLNLPKKSGHEVLAELKADERFRRIPVVVLTTSVAEEDILRAYNFHANCYIQKPGSFSEFNEVIKSLENFWFEIVRLPPV